MIAQQRPPPPGANAPYPSLGSIPPRPTPPDAAARQAIAARLARERAGAEALAAAGPLVASAPVLPALPAASPGAASASLPAMAAPAAAPRPAAGKTPAAGAALDGKPPAAGAAGGGKAPVAGAAGGGNPLFGPATAMAALVDHPPAPETTGTMPPIPAAPPAPPSGMGVRVSPPAPAPAVAPPVITIPGRSVGVTFLTGSILISGPDATALRALAAARGGKAVAVVGYGEATSFAANIQTQALRLALRRAAAIAGLLGSAGVPVAAMRITADPFGRGGSAQLVD